MTPVRILASSRLELPEKTWEHLNAWECPYKMRFASADVSQIIIRYEGQYHRCIRATITDLCYDSISGEWEKVGSALWGNAFILETKSQPDGRVTFGNCLYVQEESDTKKEPLIQKLNDPNAVIFNRLCDEIFGDG